jgi:hypothetical protein
LRADLCRFWIHITVINARTSPSAPRFLRFILVLGVSK